jgi:hypothetical protein
VRNYLTLGFILLFMSGCAGKDWRTASREPAGIAPDVFSLIKKNIKVF